MPKKTLVVTVALSLPVLSLPVGLSLASAGCSGGGGGSSGSLSASTSAVTSASSTPVTSATAPGSTPATRAPVRQSPANLATGPAVVIDASGLGPFFDRPWPLDSRRTALGGLDLGGIQNPLGRQFIANAVSLAAADTRGASPTGTIYFHFDGPVNAPVDDPVASVSPTWPILVVDIDPSSPDRLHASPYHVGVTTVADSVRPENLLEIQPLPGHGLRPSTRHAAIVLRSLGGPGAQWLGQSPVLTRLLAGQAPAGPLGSDLLADFAPLPQALQDLGINPDDVAAASCFTTGDPTARLAKQATWADALPPLAPTSALSVRDHYADYSALAGTYAPPVFQAGVPPYVFGGGNMVLDASGLPVTQWVDSAEFRVSIPKGKMPKKGFPLYFWVHGTGGNPDQFIDHGRQPDASTAAPPGTGMASYLSPRGWAMACAAGPLSPTRIGFLSAGGYAAYDLLNPVAMRDNFCQMLLEMVFFRRMLLTLRIDPALCPGTDASASPDGKIGFDPDTLIVGGQSLGSYLAGMLAALLPDWKGCVLTGAGGSWVEFPFGPTDPIKPAVVIDAFALPNGEQIDRLHPFVMAFDLSLGFADNTHYLDSVIRRSAPGHNPPHVLIVEGHGDKQVPEGLQRCDILGIGTDLAGDEVLPNPLSEQDACVLPWGGLRQLPYPVQGNRTLPNGETRTAVVVRYEHDTAVTDGHYVSFQLDAPKQQIGEFASDIAAGKVPTVAKH